MASYPDFLRSAALPADTRAHKYFDDEDGSVLDETILDSADLFSEFSDADALSATSTNPFHKNNPFAYNAPHAASWASGSCTPTTVYEAFSVEQYDGEARPSYQVEAAIAAASTAFDVRRDPAGPAFAAPAATGVTSPPTPAEWMANPAAEQADGQAAARRMRPGSPLRPRSPLLRRGDGIRKKNARFEIPAERNLHNIDHFIAQSSDDQEIKELKQQKRLLRNRQAALDSRQRKKQHTERLEEEKKTYTTIISELEERVAELELREAEHLRAQDDWKVAQQRYEQYVDGMHLEKEEMVRSHTLQTGDLRKKNAFLTDHLQRMESAAAMAAVPAAPAAFPGAPEYAGMDGVAVGAPGWDHFGFLEDFAMDEAKPDRSLVPARKAADDKPATSGLLLVLLLCGAFVASRSSTTSRPSIPRMPDDIIAASATVLDNIFKDAGVQPAEPRLAGASRVDALEPGPSDAAWPVARAVGARDMVGLSDSSLDVLHHQLARPTPEQEQEQLFSLSADQYNGVTSQDFLREPAGLAGGGGMSQGRRNLGASLAAMRDDHNKASAAEVYTRSLLWDKVPTEVVRDFARFVSDSNGDGGGGAAGHGDAAG